MDERPGALRLWPSRPGAWVCLLVWVWMWINPHWSGPAPEIHGWLMAALFLAAWGLGGAGRPLGAGVLALVLGLALVMAALVSAMLALIQFMGWEAYAAGWIYESSGQWVAHLRQRNQMATLCVMGWIAALGLQRRWLLVCASALLPLAVAGTASRVGALCWLLVNGLILGLGVGRAARSPWVALRPWAVAALLLFGLWQVLLPVWAQALGRAPDVGLLSRLAHEDASAFSRMNLWANTLQLIAQRPWLGWGWGELAYAHYVSSFDGTWGAWGRPAHGVGGWPGGRFMELLDNAHNLPLHLAVTLGVPLALICCVVGLWLVVRGRPWAEREPKRIRAWAILMVIGVHSMVEFPLWYGPFFMTALVCVGVLLAPWVTSYVPRKPSVCHEAEGPDRWARHAALWAGVMGLAAAGYVAFDYHRVSQPYLDSHQRAARYASDPYGHAAGSWLFRSQARFAKLVITPVTRETAWQVYAQATQLVHFSPEPRVIERLIESAVMLGHDDVAAFHIARYREAWPQAYAQWTALKPGL